MEFKTKIETNEIFPNCKANIYVSLDETKLFFELDYMEGRYKLERTFPNNYLGVEKMEAVKIEFQTESDVRNYFNL